MNPETPIQQGPGPQQGPVVGIVDASSVNNPPAYTNLAPSPVNNSPKKKLLVLLGAIVLFVIILVAAYLVFFMNKNVATLGVNGKTVHIPNNPSSVQAQFMTDVFAGNMKGAYGLTSSKFKSSTTETNFANTEKYISVSQLTTSNAKLTDSNKTYVVSGDITAHGVHIFNYSSRMIKQGGIWKVDNIVIQS